MSDPESDDLRPTRVLSPVPLAALELPQDFGRYRIHRQITVGEVTSYLAHDRELGRDVILQVPRFDPGQDDVAVPRFIRAARAAALVHHPNLCPILDAGQQRNVPYLTMPLIEGRPLSAVLEEGGPWSPARAADLVRKLALAMDSAHRKGVLHRDLKPACILITPEGEPIITGFGLARQVNSSRLTRDGQILGTPGYLAPEAVAGIAEADGPARDVFSLGVLLSELLTGQLPFGRTIQEVLQSARDPTSPSTHRLEVPAELSAICLKAMAHNPSDRYPGMRAFAEALQKASSLSEREKGRASRETSLPAPGRSRRRMGGVLLACGMLLAALFGGLLYRTAVPPQPRESPRQPDARPGLIGTYYRGIYFNQKRNTRIDPVVDWADVRPLIPEFSSVRWTGYLEVPRAGRYRIFADSDDGIRLWVDGRQIIDGWTHQGPTRHSATVDLDAGSHPLVLEYHQQDGSATLVLSWQPPGQSGEVPIPKEALWHDAAALTAEEQQPLEPLDQAVVVLPNLRVNAVAFLSDDRQLLTAEQDGRVGTWDVATGKQSGQPLIPNGGTQAALVLGESQVVTGGGDGVLRLWDLARGREIRRFPGRHGKVWKVLVADDRRRLISGEEGKTVSLWDVSTGTVLEQFEQGEPVRYLAVSRDGKRVLSGGPKGPLRLWTPGQKQPLWEKKYEGLDFHCLALAPGGDWALFAEHKKLVQWDLEADKRIGSLEGHLSWVCAIAVSADGRRALTGGWDTSVRLWDLTTGKERATFLGHLKPVCCVALSADGKRAASGGLDGSVRIWELP